MAQVGVAGEVVLAGVDVLQKRRFGVDQPAGPEHAPGFSDGSLRVKHVFQHGLQTTPSKLSSSKGIWCASSSRAVRLVQRTSVSSHSARGSANAAPHSLTALAAPQRQQPRVRAARQAKSTNLPIFVRGAAIVAEPRQPGGDPAGPAAASGVRLPPRRNAQRAPLGVQQRRTAVIDRIRGVAVEADRHPSSSSSRPRHRGQRTPRSSPVIIAGIRSNDRRKRTPGIGRAKVGLASTWGVEAAGVGSCVTWCIHRALGALQ
jgi:hypothetical protein